MPAAQHPAWPQAHGPTWPPCLKTGGVAAVSICGEGQGGRESRRWACCIPRSGTHRGAGSGVGGPFPRERQWWNLSFGTPACVTVRPASPTAESAAGLKDWSPERSHWTSPSKVESGALFRHVSDSQKHCAVTQERSRLNVRKPQCQSVEEPSREGLAQAKPPPVGERLSASLVLLRPGARPPPHICAVFFLCPLSLSGSRH